ncbi:hypothetical protein PLICRDRAFT_46769 [Plicaturopsis crispa FD-325 SS-3]|uniref:DUF6534 domain-containing protein n=1 Tax=Plicaturopsis crispa FD-325 SS-3 TaxID=944288 RepID=A0A0C9SKM3_PLICR|nr:hypothetical protein PLICRDRAFT_46769 [Plicaturopsis crispa FD-325 SS-3]
MATYEIDKPTKEQLVLLASPYLLGVLFNGVLLGCLSLQLYIYSVSSSSDGMRIKTLVYVLYIIELVQTAITMYYAWSQLVWSQGPYESVYDVEWSLCVLQLLAGIVSCIAQCFFARRIWILKNTRMMGKVVTCIFLLVVVQSASAIVNSIQIFINMTNAEVQVESMWYTARFVCDSLIAGSLLHILIKARAHTRIKKTTTILTRLIVVTIQTGFITAVVTGLQLTSYLIDLAVMDQYYIMLSLLLGKLYLNVLLATLNARIVAVHVADNESEPGLTTMLGFGMVFRTAPPAISQAAAPSALTSVSDSNENAHNEPPAATKEHADGDLHIQGHLRLPLQR